eukprot:3176433-Pyramimonas_sp.AAC.1
MAELTPGTRRMHEEMDEWMGLEGSLLGGGRLPPTDEAQEAERSKVAGDAEEEQADEVNEEKADEAQEDEADEVEEVPVNGQKHEGEDVQAAPGAAGEVEATRAKGAGP